MNNDVEVSDQSKFIFINSNSSQRSTIHEIVYLNCEIFENCKSENTNIWKYITCTVHSLANARRKPSKTQNIDYFCNKNEFQRVFFKRLISKLNMALDSPRMKTYKSTFH